MVKRDHIRQSTSRTSAAAEPRQSKGRARTRASGVKLIQDPKDVDKILGQQLAQMGLYAAHTLGDGNCLFRALSDQCHGTPEHHARIRTDVCNYLAEHEARYRAFVDTDEEESWEARLHEMRKQGTYGGHLELSAFASLHQRPIKVIQPGMIYVIGYEDESPNASGNGKGKARQAKPRAEVDRQSTLAPLYIVYHEWEHYSSVRNLAGPHCGPPQICEKFHPGSFEQEERDSPSIDEVVNPSAEINLLIRSLPDGVSYSQKQLAAWIAQSGSWEKALENILGEEEASSPQEPFAGKSISTSLSMAGPSLLVPSYRDPSPSFTSATTASSPEDSTALSSASVSSQAQVRKLSRSHSRSPEPSDSPDEGIGRRLRPRRSSTGTSRLLQLPKFGCRSSATSSYASSISGSSSGSATSPEINTSQLRPQCCRTRSSPGSNSPTESPKTVCQAHSSQSASQEDAPTKPRQSRLALRTPATASHSPLGKSTMNRMSKKEARQAQRRLTRAQERSTSLVTSGTGTVGRTETISLFRELRV